MQQNSQYKTSKLISSHQSSSHTFILLTPFKQRFDGWSLRCLLSTSLRHYNYYFSGGHQKD